MEWWKSNKHRFNSWKEVKDAIRKYYGEHYKLDKAINELGDLKQIGTVQTYVNDIDIHNVYTKMTDHQLVNMILNRIILHLR